MRAKEVRELKPFVEKINDPILQDVLKDKLQELTESPLYTDKWVYRSVVWALGVVIILCLCFTLTVVLKNSNSDVAIEIPDIFLAVGSASIGALAGLLAPPPKSE